MRPVRHAQRIAPINAKRHILADRWHLGIIRAEPLKSIVILGTPVCKAFQRPELALISLLDHGYNPLICMLFSCPLSWGWRVSLFAPRARDQNAANLAGTTGGGCNLFCGEVHRLPLGLCQHPGGLAAIVGDGCAL